MSNDFEKIASDMRVHFCPLCKASFGCEHEDGECDCVGQEYADNWRKPWCPHCFDLKRNEIEKECTCPSPCSWLGHLKGCPRYTGDMVESNRIAEIVSTAYEFIEASFMATTILDTCTACDMANCQCAACVSCKCPDCKK